jgi:hypothetical protein
MLFTSILLLLYFEGSPCVFLITFLFFSYFAALEFEFKVWWQVISINKVRDQSISLVVESE